MSINTINVGNLEYLTAEGIDLPHCFTTRFGGVSEGYLSSLNLGIHRGDDPRNVEKNYEILGEALGFDIHDLVFTRQTHTDIVRVVDEENRGEGLQREVEPECDALVTNTPGLVLAAFSADCTPILLHDTVTGAVGAVHAGWRGTAAGIVSKAVAAMVTSFGCRAEDICAAIGPNIGPCCFETDRDVPDAMIAALGDSAVPYIQSAENKFHVDLKGLNALWLHHSSVTNIEISTDCTACAPNRFWSHRITSGKRGSQGAVIVCKEGRLCNG